MAKFVSKYQYSNWWLMCYKRQQVWDLELNKPGTNNNYFFTKVQIVHTEKSTHSEHIILRRTLRWKIKKEVFYS